MQYQFPSTGPALLLLLLVLSTQIHCDCPMLNYPKNTIIGFMEIDVSNDLNLRESSTVVIYTLTQPLNVAVPLVFIGINSIDAAPGRNLIYSVTYRPTPSFSTLGFEIAIEDDEFRWNSLRFNFMATGNQLFEILAIDNLVFANVPNSNSIFGATDLRLRREFPGTPSVRVYITGMDISARESTSTVPQMARPSSNNPISRQVQAYLDRLELQAQAEASSTEISLRLTGHSLSGLLLNVQLEKGRDTIFRSVKINYLAFYDDLVRDQHQYIQGQLSLQGNRAEGFEPLDRTQMTLTGINGVQSSTIDPMNFRLFRAENEDNFVVFANLESDQLLNLHNFQIMIKNEFECSSCQNSIFKHDGFCLRNCPVNFINIPDGINSRCAQCKLDEFRIPNDLQTACSCATRYYQDRRTGQCEACDLTCFTCSQASRCDTCDDSLRSTNRVLQRGQCQCRDGFYDDSDNGNIVCQRCAQNCARCSGNKPNQCQECQNGFKKDVFGNCNCGTNFVEIRGECVCQQPNFLLDDDCYAFIRQGQCQENARRTTRNGTEFCECQNGYFNAGDNLCIQCKENQVFNAQTFQCQCAPNMIQFQDRCILCEADQVFDPQLGACKCRGNLQLDNEGKCIKCPSKSIYIQGECRCIFNYYQNNQGRCVKCEQGSRNAQCRLIEQ